MALLKGMRAVGKSMLTDLIHRLGIATPTETIYRAATTEDSFHAW